MKKPFLFFSLLILVLNVFSQNVKKGFKNLEKSEFNEAKIIFEEVLKGNNKDILANYGLAILNNNSSYPSKDFFKAYFYINTTDSLFNNADVKEQGKLDKYLTKDTILYFKEKIESKLLEFVGKENNLEVTDKFLSECKNSQHYDIVVLLKYQQEYKLALTANTIESFETFISKYPKAKEVQDAQTNIHILAFAKAKLQNTEDALNDFVKKYPSANQMNEAIELRNAVAFENVKKTNTIESYGQFIEQYKSSKQLPEAKLLLCNLKFELAKNSKSAFALKKFINDCPAATQAAEAKKMYLDIAILIPFQQGNHWGYADDNHNVLIEPTFDSVTTFKGNYTVVMNKPDAYILIDRLGNHLTNKSYNFIDSVVVEGLLKVKYNNLYGFIDTTGFEKIPPAFNYCSNFEKGFAKVVRSTIKFDSNFEIPFSNGGYNYYMNLFNESEVKTKQNWNCGLINSSGKLVLDIKYFDIQMCGNLFWCSVDGEKWFLLNKSFAQISKEYDNIYGYNDGVFMVNDGGGWEWYEGPFIGSGKFGFVDTTGTEVVPVVYEYANHFSEGLAYVELDKNKKGFIDKKNNVKIFFSDLKGTFWEKLQYNFDKGSVKLTKGTKLQNEEENYGAGSTIDGWFCIDKTGNNIPCRKEKSENNFIKKQNFDNITEENSELQVKGTFTDSRDGKTYKTVKIGTQTWMAENLAYKANSGCWAYNDDVTNVAKYGYLYNWETAKTVCPTGWHLPSDAEWTTLTTYFETTYLAGDEVAGGKLKSTIGWNSPNSGATNSSGFTAVPGGYRDNYETFYDIGNYGYWWSSTENYIDFALYRLMNYELGNVGNYGTTESNGFSVRCVKH